MIVETNCFDVSAGPESKNPAVERREASILIARDARRLARAGGPASSVREGCLASTRAPVGAPLPHFEW